MKEDYPNTCGQVEKSSALHSNDGNAEGYCATDAAL